jgi:hypothetical protein
MRPKFTLGTTIVGWVMLVLWGVAPLVAGVISPETAGLRDRSQLPYLIAISGIFILSGIGVIRRRHYAWWLAASWLALLWTFGLSAPLSLVGRGGITWETAVVLLITFTLFFGGAFLLLVLPTVQQWRRMRRSHEHP